MKRSFAYGLLFAWLMGTLVGQDIITGLTAHYTFDGNAGDKSGHGNDATPEGNYQYTVAGRTDGALRIQGDGALYYSGGGYVGLPLFGSEFNQGFTISFWAKDEVIGQNPVGEEEYVSIGVLDLPQMGIRLNNNNPASPKLTFYLVDLSAGQNPGNYAFIEKSIPNLTVFAASWKHFVLTYEPGRFAAFLNGEKLGEASVTFGGFPVSHAVMGRHWWSSGGASSARMSVTYDDVLIYNRALTDNSVAALYGGLDPCTALIQELQAEIAALKESNAQLTEANGKLDAEVTELVAALDEIYRLSKLPPGRRASGTNFDGPNGPLINAIIQTLVDPARK